MYDGIQSVILKCLKIRVLAFPTLHNAPNNSLHGQHAQIKTQKQTPSFEIVNSHLGFKRESTSTLASEYIFKRSNKTGGGVCFDTLKKT